MSILTMHHGLMAGIKQGGLPMPQITVTIGNLVWAKYNSSYDVGTEGVDVLTHPWSEGGKLYAYDLIEREIIPKLSGGWRVPTNTDFENLRDYAQAHLGDAVNIYQALVIDDLTYSTWPATNSSGFTAYITGYGTRNWPNISNQKMSTNFWTSTKSGVYQMDWCLQNGNSFQQLTHRPTDYLLCLRLVKDA